MNRFFRAPIAVSESIRNQVIDSLDLPNGFMDTPWANGGDFKDGTNAYTALGTHHTSGPIFGPLTDQMLAVPGVSEITEQEYLEARNAD